MTLIQGYLLFGLIYLIWTQVISEISKHSKTYIDPLAEKQIHPTALLLGKIAGHIVMSLIWPITVLWQIQVYEYVDQQLLFYEKMFKELEANMKQSKEDHKSGN